MSLDDSTSITIDKEPVESDNNLITIDKEPVESDNNLITIDKEPVESDNNLITIDKEPVESDGSLGINISCRIFRNVPESDLVFAFQKLNFQFNDDQEDPCDKCGKLILYGAFVPSSIIQPKIAINEAYLCKECYTQNRDEMPSSTLPFDDKSQIRFFDPKITLGNIRYFIQSKVFLNYSDFLMFYQECMRDSGINSDF